MLDERIHSQINYIIDWVFLWYLKKKKEKPVRALFFFDFSLAKNPQPKC